jgi:phosphoglycolate phosphatase-like HAD superfamily hydrolase
VLNLAQSWGIALAESFLVGDKASDMLTGQRAGCHTILVTGDAAQPPPPLAIPSDLVVSGLSDAVAYLLEVAYAR